MESADNLKARGYDLSARNPVLNEREALPHPAELTARLLERTRELTSILENLHAMVNNGGRQRIAIDWQLPHDWGIKNLEL